MGIHGLTIKSHDEAERIAPSYFLWKGDPKTDTRPGTDLRESFRFTGSETHTSIFKRHYGDRPKEVKIYFPCAHPSRNLTAWCEKYEGSQFVHRCDGRHILEKMVDVQRRGTKGKIYNSIRRITCMEPCLKGSASICPDPDCNPLAHLYFIIPEFIPYAAGNQRIGSIALTSIHDIGGCLSQLEAIYSQFQNLMSSPFPSRETCGYIPFVLSREVKSIKCPGPENKRIRRDVWLLKISVDPNWLKAFYDWSYSQSVKQLTGNAEGLEKPGLTPSFDCKVDEVNEIDVSHELIEIDPSSIDEKRDLAQSNKRKIWAILIKIWPSQEEARNAGSILFSGVDLAVPDNIMEDHLIQMVEDRLLPLGRELSPDEINLIKASWYDDDPTDMILPIISNAN